MKLANEIKLSVFSLLILLIINSCVVVSLPAKPEKTLIGHEELCAGNLYGDGEEGLNEQQIIVESQEELEALLEKMSSINPNGCSDILMTIDFEEFDLIFLLDRVRGTGGYSIEVTEVSKLDELVSVEYKHITPLNTAAPSVMTQPFVFVQVLKLNSEVRFILSE